MNLDNGLRAYQQNTFSSSESLPFCLGLDLKKDPEAKKNFFAISSLRNLVLINAAGILKIFLLHH